MPKKFIRGHAMVESILSFVSGQAPHDWIVSLKIASCDLFPKRTIVEIQIVVLYKEIFNVSCRSVQHSTDCKNPVLLQNALVCHVGESLMTLLLRIDEYCYVQMGSQKSNE